MDDEMTISEVKFCIFPCLHFHLHANNTHNMQIKQSFVLNNYKFHQLFFGGTAILHIMNAQ